MSTPAVDAITADAFRVVMADVCTPVTVITALRDLQPYGTTVSAFAALSLAPPMVLVSLDRTSNLLPVVRETARFGVNVLGSGQHGLATGFARKGGDKFAGVAWDLDACLPRIAGVPGWLACDVDNLVEGGDHVIALGTVVAASSRPGAPLTYFRRAFGTHEPLPPV